MLVKRIRDEEDVLESGKRKRRRKELVTRPKKTYQKLRALSLFVSSYPKVTVNRFTEQHLDSGLSPEWWMKRSIGCTVVPSVSTMVY